MGRQLGNGPDDLGDDEQEAEVTEYEQYVEDPPDGGLVIAEDVRGEGEVGGDAEAAQDWAAKHPQAATAKPEADDESAEQAAIHEVPGT
jgi:hypothetical protein